MTARRGNSPARPAIARLSATPRFVRSIEERTTAPRSSTSSTGSSLHEYQSTTRRRFSFVIASRFTPRSRNSARTASGDCDAVTTSPLPPAFRPSARKVSAKRNFSWPGGPCSRMLDPSGSPPWTIASNPSMPVASRVVRSPLEGAAQAAPQRQVGMGADRVPEGPFESGSRRARPEALRAHGPEVSVHRRDELPQTVDAPVAAGDHLIEDRLAQLLVVRREAVLHLRLNRRRADESDPFEQGVEVRDVEVDHLAQRPGVVLEVELEAEAGVPESIFGGPRIVRPSLDEAELPEPLQELRRGRDVDVQAPCDLAREMPAVVAELGVHKGIPGILTSDCNRVERTFRGRDSRRGRDDLRRRPTRSSRLEGTALPDGPKQG